MAKRNRFNMVGRLQDWMDSVAGQTFLNYAYSWGAAVVILGTLFKLTHLPYANLFLYLGMGTEVLVFIIAAFDRTFAKNTEQEERLEGECKTTMGMQDVVETLLGQYLRQIKKVKEQQEATERLNSQIRMQNIYMEELNRVYAKMLQAVGQDVAEIKDRVELNRQ